MESEPAGRTAVTKIEGEIGPLNRKYRLSLTRLPAGRILASPHATCSSPITLAHCVLIHKNYLSCKISKWSTGNRELCSSQGGGGKVFSFLPKTMKTS